MVIRSELRMGQYRYDQKPFWGLFDILGVLLGDPRGVDAIKAEIWSDDWFILILKFIQILDLAVV